MNEPHKNDSPESHELVWEQGWLDHSRRQLKRLAQLPLSEKLIWLEEAHRVVLHMKSEQIGSGKRD